MRHYPSGRGDVSKTHVVLLKLLASLPPVLGEPVDGMQASAARVAKPESDSHRTTSAICESISKSLESPMKQKLAKTDRCKEHGSLEQQGMMHSARMEVTAREPDQQLGADDREPPKASRLPLKDCREGGTVPAPLMRRIRLTGMRLATAGLSALAFPCSSGSLPNRDSELRWSATTKQLSAPAHAGGSDRGLVWIMLRKRRRSLAAHWVY